MSNIGRWSFQRPTLYSWLNSVLRRRFRFGCRFQHFVASGTCLDTHACCRTPISCFMSYIARFPVVFCLKFVSPLHVILLHYVVFLNVLFPTCIAWFSAPVLFPHCMSYTCIAWFYSAFCFLAYIAFRAMVLTV